MPSRSSFRLAGLAVSTALTASTLAAEPPNRGAEVTIGTSHPTFEIRYNGSGIFEGEFSVSGQSDLWKQVRLRVTSESGSRGEVTQHIALEAPQGAVLRVTGKVLGSDQAIAAETDSPAQKRFKLVRNSVGPSSNLRNNSVYDRKWDWMLEGAGDGGVTVAADPARNGHAAFRWTTSGSTISLTFRPRYYQKHKNIAYFRPWEYDVWRGSVTGWCSWWAYFADVHEKDVERVSQVFADKLSDFGYKYIQIDDGYQSGSGGLPSDWLHTNSRFPSGLAHLATSIASKGLEPALWLNVHFGNAAFVAEHPQWFIQDGNGAPHKGPWIDYGLDGSVKDAIDNVVLPTYSAIHKMGWRYIKVDALRHLLYDASYPCRAYFSAKGIKPEDAFRDYLAAIRHEVGDDTYMLACWGVLPEAVGIANGCRLGGDGFGPSTLQQYTSWNNIVWRNDPDHCDIEPQDKKTGVYLEGEQRIRPVLVSMAGAQLLLSDKPEVYENDANLEGVKRSSPILFTQPGQLYDYDPVKTDHLKQGLRNENGGANSGPIDADQRGEVCPWWMLDINRPFESWTVLARMNWEHAPMPQAEVKFKDLGLPDATYSVFEFWSKKYLGDFHGSFTTKSLDPKDVAVYAIRRTLDRPQVLSTSRHITQGGYDLKNVSWSGRTLSGTSEVVKSDPYSIYVRLPAGYGIRTAEFSAIGAEIRVADTYAEIKFVPSRTGTVRWKIETTRG